MESPEAYINKLENRIKELENIVKVLKKENEKLSSNFIVSIASESESGSQELRNKMIEMENIFDSSVNEYKQKLIYKDQEIHELRRKYENNPEIPNLPMEKQPTSHKNTPLRNIQQCTFSDRRLSNKPNFYPYKSLGKVSQKENPSQVKKKTKHSKQPLLRKNSQHYIPSFMKLAKFNKL